MKQDSIEAIKLTAVFKIPTLLEVSARRLLGKNIIRKEKGKTMIQS